MSDRKLHTQGELDTLAEELITLVDNLGEHANSPLDKAHGINWVKADVDPGGDLGVGYYDSGGDRLTEAVATGNNIVLRVSAGDSHQIFYVPTLMAAAAQAPIMVDKPGLAKSLSGIPPAERALVTEYTADLEEEARIHNLVLFEHAKAISSSLTPRAHGQVSSSGISDTGSPPVHLRDTLGHRLGRYVVLFRVGNLIYHVPCDTERKGPPQGARKIAGGEPVAAATSYAPDGGGQPSLSVTYSVKGDRPIAFRWRAASTLAALTDVSAVGTRIFTAANFTSMTFTDGFFSAATGTGSVGIAGGAANWSFGLPSVSNGSGVGVASCTVTATPGSFPENTMFANDLFLCCDAMGPSDITPVTSIVVRWSCYDETLGCFDDC